MCSDQFGIHLPLIRGIHVCKLAYLLIDHLLFSHYRAMIRPRNSMAGPFNRRSEPNQAGAARQEERQDKDNMPANCSGHIFE